MAGICCPGIEVCPDWVWRRKHKEQRCLSCCLLCWNQLPGEEQLPQLQQTRLLTDTIFSPSTTISVPAAREKPDSLEDGEEDCVEMILPH